MNIGINDKLDALISLIAKECGNDDIEMFNNLDTSKVSLDRGVYVKQKQTINKHKHINTVRLIKKCFVRVAVALMALMSLGFLTIMATPDLREAVFEAVVEWYEDYISIQYKPVEEDTHKSNITDESTDISLTENPGDESEIPVISLPPTKIEKVMKPTYIPEGLEEDVVVSNISVVVIDYYHGDDLVFYFQQILFQDNEKLFDNQSVVIRNTEINGNVASIVEYDSRGEKAIIWTDGIYYYQIYLYTEYVSEDELINIATSVK